MAANVDNDDDEITSINVTPLVDVTLVLLIIFMVTTSVIANPEGINIDKPDAATGTQMEQSRLILKCYADGSIKIDDREVVTDDEINAAIASKLAETPNVQGIVVCDEKAQAGMMVHLIDLLRKAGVQKYGVATEKPPGTAG